MKKTEKRMKLEKNQTWRPLKNFTVYRLVGEQINIQKCAILKNHYVLMRVKATKKHK